MKLMVCLDERGGMAFNGRRQSRDRRVCEDMVREVGKACLAVRPESAALFSESAVELLVCADPMSEAGEGDACFLETQKPILREDTDTVVIYRWNRHYPADLTFDADLSAFRMTRHEEFAGTSHENITKEVWKR